MSKKLKRNKVLLAGSEQALLMYEHFGLHF